MSDFTLRLMKPSDADRLKEIVSLSFSRFMGFWTVRSLLSSEGQVLVSETHDAVTGFAKLISFEIDHVNYGCILWIAVHPTFRRRGVANALTAEGVRLLKEGGGKALFASTQRRKTGAQIVLKQNGFRRAGFVDLWRIFHGRVFQFYRDIWLAPGEIVFMRD